MEEIKSLNGLRPGDYLDIYHKTAAQTAAEEKMQRTFDVIARKRRPVLVLKYKVTVRTGLMCHYEDSTTYEYEYVRGVGDDERGVMLSRLEYAHLVRLLEESNLPVRRFATSDGVVIDVNYYKAHYKKWLRERYYNMLHGDKTPIKRITDDEN